MHDTLSAFRSHGRLNQPLVAAFLLILGILFVNAILHDPTAGYDAQDHVHYVQTLAAGWRLPTRAETGQYYSPPLPYALPAALTALHLGLWKALKIAQLFNVLLAAASLVYLLRICELVSPGNTRLKILALAALGLLPVLYRSFALVRGEPYLAFLGLYITHRSLLLFLKRQYSARNVLLLGIALGLAILARQWGFFLFPPILVFAAWGGLENKPIRLLPFGLACGSMLLALLVGGWFYALTLRQYGTLAAFDRAPQRLSSERVGSLLTPDDSSLRLFSDPIRPSLHGRLLPILYADTWGDYWGYFLVYARDLRTGEFEDGIVFQKLVSPSQLPPDLSTNRFRIGRYLGLLNFLDLLPSALFLMGLVTGVLSMLRFLARRPRDDLDRAAALLAMTVVSSLLGYAWFVVRYQGAAQGGDLIKATYILQACAPMAFLVAACVDRSWQIRRSPWQILIPVLVLIFVVEIPAFLTRYVHFAASPAALGFGLSTFFFLSGLAATWWIHDQYHLDVVVERAPPPQEGPLITVCVPARNEETNIRSCTLALLHQTYPRFEVIVVDDRSTDATPAILRELSKNDPRLRVLHGSRLPEGWAGKPHALAQAAAEARGEWLCFVDADTILSPDALASCHARALDTRADLFTIMTRQITGTFWERTVMPLVITALSVGFPPREVNDPGRRAAVANGQFILIKRPVYEALGGHGRIKDQIVEDKALAELVKWNGYRLVVADGRPVASTRMYTSLPQMWEGWTKNIYLGLSAQPKLLLLGAFGGLLLVLAAAFLPAWPLIGLSWYLGGGGWLALAAIMQALLLWAAVLYARAGVAHAMGISRWYALTTPLGAGIFAAMMLVSAWKVLSGRGVTWRGRTYIPG